MLRACMCVLVLTAAMACAQEWEVGAIGGFGAGNDFTVKRGDGATASAGLKNGAVFGVYGGEDMYRYWSGEATYLYRQSSLKESSAGVSESFAAHTHLMTGEILAHFKPRESRMRPFFSFGGGLKLLAATGDEGAPQPLCLTASTCFAALTATRQVQPVGVIGAGVKYKVNNHLRLRVQIRDFISTKPKDVIAPGPGSTMSGIPNDFVATLSVGYIW
ncbi:MAG TPA: outer membrane beta-barrel protein [Bryobacteraceae bacterium]|nr:outer membrane beta-barrel protein [Bryobacteraceae bacterium]